MKQKWTMAKMADVFDLQMGKTPDRNEPCFWNGRETWVSIGDMKGSKYISSSCECISIDAVSRSGIKQVPKGTVIMSFKLSVGKVAITSIPLYTNEAIMAFKVKPDVNLIPEYVYYYLKGYKWQGSNRAVMGITLNKSSISQGLFAYPCRNEQSRIVAELDLLTGVIDKQKAELKELDTLAQSIFYDMFGDPIENPKGWNVKTIGDICRSVSYGTSAKASSTGRYKYLRMNNITYSGELDQTDLKYIDMTEAEYEKYSVVEGDVLFNRTNSLDLIGKTTYMHGFEPMIIAGYIIRVRLNDMALSVYVSKFMNTPALKKLLKSMAKGAVNQSNINSKELQSIKIPVPPLPLQQAFADKIASIEKQKAAIIQSMAETQKLLDYTMDKYFG